MEKVMKFSCYYRILDYFTLENVSGIIVWHYLVDYKEIICLLLEANIFFFLST